MRYQSKGVLGDASRHVAIHELLARANGSDLSAAAEAQLVLERLSTSKADSTKKQYDRVMDHYLWFSLKNRRDPWAGEPQIIAAFLYVTAKSNTKQVIAARAAIIRDVFIGKGLPDPLNHRLVADMLDALLSEAPTRRRTHDILLLNDVRALKRTLSTSSLTGLRDTVEIGLGWILMLRQESILRLTTRDVSVSGGRLHVHSSYKGKALYQCIDSNEGDGLVEHVRDYLERAEIAEGPLFRAIENDRIVGTKAIEKSRLDRMFKERLILAGFDPARYCWTSLRYGFLYWAYQRQFGDVELGKRAGFETFGRLQSIIDGITSGIGGFRLPAADARVAPQRFDFESYVEEAR